MKNQSTLSKYLEWTILALALFGTFRLLSETGLMEDLKPTDTQSKLIFWIGMVVIIFVSLGVHELGHLLTGLVQGFAFQLFVVGPLGIKREDDRIKVYFNTNLGYYGGVAASFPTDNSPDNPRKFARLIIAGPIASLLFAGLCFLLAPILGPPWGMVWYVGGVVSIAIFFATTIPSRTGMFFTDRKRFQRLITPGKDQQVEEAMLRIIGQYAAEGSYRNVAVEDLNTVAEDDFPYIRFYGLFNLMCYQLEMDGQIAPELRERYQETAGSIPKNVVAAFDKEIDRHCERLADTSD